MGDDLGDFAIVESGGADLGEVVVAGVAAGDDEGLGEIDRGLSSGV